MFRAVQQMCFNYVTSARPPRAPQMRACCARPLEGVLRSPPQRRRLPLQTENPRVAGLCCAAGAPRDAKEFYLQWPGPSHIITWYWKRKIYRVSINDVWSTSRPSETLRVETSPPDLCFFAAGLGRWANPLPLALQLSWRQASNVHLEAPPYMSRLVSIHAKTLPTCALLLHVARL